MIHYLLHVAILLACCYLVYRLLLQTETFYRLNRWFLMMCMVLPFSLPLIEIPSYLSLRGSFEIPTYSEAVIAERVEEGYEESAPAVMEEIPYAEESMVNEAVAPHMSLATVAWYIYLTGLGIFGFNFLIQLGSLLYQMIKLPKLKDKHYHIVDLTSDKPPFSFLNYIFINPNKYEYETYNQILDHEKVHVDQLHSVDMLLAECLVAVQWFNPFAWWYRRAVENNLEFLTDSTMLEKGTPAEAYQMNLLKVSVPQHPLGLVTSYNQSVLKKRISMMNKMRSSLRSSWKYVSILPLLFLSMAYLNVVKMQASPDPEPLVQEMPKASGEAVVQANPTPTPTPQPAKAEPVEIAKEEKKQKTSSSENHDFVYEGPIKGVWRGELDQNEVCIKFDLSELKKGQHWNMWECFDRSEFSNLPMNNDGSFSLTREAGELKFTGSFEDGDGLGRFTFAPSANYVSFLKKEGYGDISEKNLFHFFIADFNKAYFSFLKKEGYNDLTGDQLVSFAIHGLDLAYLKDYLATWKNRGGDPLTAQELVQMKIHSVSTTYIREMDQLGFNDLSSKQLVQGKIHSVKPSFVKEVRDRGFDELTFQNFVQFSIHSVNLDLIEGLEDAGYDNLGAKDFVQARIHNINLDLISAMDKAGYVKPTFQELVQFSIHSVRPEAIKAFRGIGYKDLSPQQLIQTRIHSAGPEFIKGFQKLGFKDIPIQQAIQLRIHGVRPEYIERAIDQGFTDKSLNEYIQLKIHGRVK